jgi:hypothetical protein
MFEYKVVFRESGSYSRRDFTSKDCENILNELAVEGWELDKVFNTKNLITKGLSVWLVFRRTKNTEAPT